MYECIVKPASEGCGINVMEDIIGNVLEPDWNPWTPTQA